MNRLATETSPYLRQHADNPVDWYPWGDEAFERARAEGKPIFLSIGYSTCHWCHVMAHESFEDPAIAAKMNADFVCIKVDREERPDIDSVYMTFTQALTGHGGWPMTVFLTPELKPFYAGTYFPPADQRGMPGLPRLLDSITHAWTADRGRVLESAATIVTKMRDATEAIGNRAGALGPDVAERVVQTLTGMYDHEAGGFGGAPKFPPVSTLEFLLTYQTHAAVDERAAILEMVTHTLGRMAAGGIYDQLGGGFARYAVDAHWLVPHFEKMLYDNAQLARLYLHAFQVTHDPEHERIARETLDYLLREMRDPAGGFYAAQDADSEGIEGKFFVWTVEEIEAVLGASDGQLFCAVFDVTPLGNFEDPHHPELEDRSVLSRPYPLSTIAVDRGIPVDDLARTVETLRARMLAAREQRVHPSRDDKVLTSWNGLALSAFAEGGRILGEPRYLEAALGCAGFLRDAMWDGERLLHAYGEGRAHVEGMIDDYAMLGLGLVDLYRATGDLGHLAWAEALLGRVAAQFHDDADGGFFEAPLDGEPLVLKQKPFFDAPTPSGNGAVALLAAWLGRYTGRAEWEAVATEVIGLVGDQFERAPTGFATTLQALELSLAPRREIAIVGTANARTPFEREVAQRFLPTTLIAPAPNGGGLPVLEGRDVAQGAAAYVCEEMVCKLPATTVEALRDQLDQ